jgi:hypothetical protein
MLLIRYILDAMHCEMNLAKNFLKTVVGTKDTVKVRRDLQRKNIKKHLWLVRNPRRGRKMLKPATPYVLNDDKFKVFANTIENLKTSKRAFIKFGKTHSFQEVQRLKVPRLSHLHAAATAPRSLGFVTARATDGNHEDVQSVQKDMYKSLQPS